MRWAVIWGLVGATVYSLIASVLFLLQGQQYFKAHGLTYGATVAGYFAAGIAAGAVIGVARPLTRYKIGAYFVGALAGIAGMVPIGSMTSGPPWGWKASQFVLLVFLGTAFGAGILGSELHNPSGDSSGARR